MENTVKTTSRKARTIRRENAGESTSEQNTITAPSDTQVEGTVIPPAVADSKGIVLIDSRMNQLTHGWGKVEVKDTRDLVTFAISQMVGAAESKIAVGDRFNKFAEKHGDKVNMVIKETAKLGINGLTESNIALWRIRAREIPKHLPNPAVRKYVLAMTGGEGVIVRDESFDEKDSDNKPKPKPYILSPFWAESIKQIGPVPTSENDEVAELYARKVAAQAGFLRTKARTMPEDARIRKQFTGFGKRAIGWLESHESLVWTELQKMVTAIAKETTDLEEFEAFCGVLDKVLNGVTETRDAAQNGKGKASAKVA